MMKDRPPAPVGYVLVDEGKVRSSDLCFCIYDGLWGHPTMEDWRILGSNIHDYYAVARKLKEAS